MSKNKTFKDYYKFPLKSYDFDVAYIWTQNNKMALNYLSNDILKEDVQADKNRIISVINGEIESPYKDVYINENGIIYIDNKPKLIIRGWGMLVGVGAYNLPRKEAANIQDEFRDYIISKLKGE